jgi:hypothetical protein
MNNILPDDILSSLQYYLNEETVISLSLTCKSVSKLVNINYWSEQVTKRIIEISHTEDIEFARQLTMILGNPTLELIKLREGYIKQVIATRKYSYFIIYPSIKIEKLKMMLNLIVTRSMNKVKLMLSDEEDHFVMRTGDTIKGWKDYLDLSIQGRLCDCKCLIRPFTIRIRKGNIYTHCMNYYF